MLRIAFGERRTIVFTIKVIGIDLGKSLKRINPNDFKASESICFIALLSA